MYNVQNKCFFKVHLRAPQFPQDPEYDLTLPIDCQSPLPVHNAPSSGDCSRSQGWLDWEVVGPGQCWPEQDQELW
jgi:hypothetical protein